MHLSGEPSDRLLLMDEQEPEDNQPQVRFLLSNQQANRASQPKRLKRSHKITAKSFKTTVSKLQSCVSSGGQQMIDHLSQFVAQQRNVIPEAQGEVQSSTTTTTSTTTTNIITASEQSPHSPNGRFNNNEDNHQNNGGRLSKDSHRRSYFTHRHHPIRFSSNYSEDNSNHNLEFPNHNVYCKTNGTFDSHHHKRSRVVQTLSALLKPNQRNKTTLLVSLLRAPAFLAALFSLVLVLTLMVLYTLSFHSHLQHHQQQQKQQQSQQQGQQNLPESRVQDSTETQYLESIDSFASDHLQSAPRRSASYQPSKQSRELAAGGKFITLAPANGQNYDQAENDSGQNGAQANQEEEEEDEDFQVYSNDNGSSSFTRALTIQTECGPFLGKPEGNAIVFRGIPYASPPIGARRWSRPRPIWLDPHLCRSGGQQQQQQQRRRADLEPEVGGGGGGSQRGVDELARHEHCAQLSPMTHRFTGHEDCLYLDIYAPQLGDQFKKLPVMVYIHGGFLAYGSGRSTRHPKSEQSEGVNWMRARPSGRLAADMDVIMVSFNFRLQALGFMTLQQLAQNNGPEGSEGNYGLWDQLVALNWIKRNIESFGGDPENIVIFGPDSASALPMVLLLRGGGGGEPAAGSADLGANGKKSSTSAAASLGLASGLPFRAAWLTNPTVYYDLPYEKANRHYQRLLVSQSSCYNGSGNSNGASHQSLRNESNSSSRKSDNSQSNSDHIMADKSNKLLDCLMGLSGEQIVRQYLGSDDSAYRLDDQNSLPIHGILADQFVTVDRELVAAGSSYPSLLMSSTGFNGGTSGSYRNQSDTKSAAVRLAADWPPDERSSAASNNNSSVASLAANIAAEASGQAANEIAEVGSQKGSPKLAPLITSEGDFSGSPLAGGAGGRHIGPDNCPGGSICDDVGGGGGQTKASGRSSTTTTTQATTATTTGKSAGLSSSRGELLAELANSSQQKGKTNQRRARDLASTSPSPPSLRPPPPPPPPPPSERPLEVGEVSGQRVVQLLLGSTAQAVEYWPCPRDLDSWSWADFRRYVATSLNSFSMDTYEEASRLYEVPVAESSSSPEVSAKPAIHLQNTQPPTPPRGPKETYLTMVSDIRQLCPINELAASLERRPHFQVNRYIVETPPSSSLRELRRVRPRRGAHHSIGASFNSTESQLYDSKQEFAFHMWDLIAFFGFQWEAPEFKPSARDLAFQRQIRKLVKEFVHQDAAEQHQQRQQPPELRGDNHRQFDGTQAADKFKLFTKQAELAQVDGQKHKQLECSMWRRHLGRSYAWVS